MSGRLILYIVLGAALGALLRYFFSLKCNLYAPFRPYGTLIANLLGGFFVGCVIYLGTEKKLIPHDLLIGITTGFLGGLTTFSTFSAESFVFFEQREYGRAAVHVIAHVGGAFLLLIGGHSLTRWAWTMWGRG